MAYNVKDEGTFEFTGQEFCLNKSSNGKFWAESKFSRSQWRKHRMLVHVKNPLKYVEAIGKNMVEGPRKQALRQDYIHLRYWLKNGSNYDFTV